MDLVNMLRLGALLAGTNENLEIVFDDTDTQNGEDADDTDDTDDTDADDTDTEDAGEGEGEDEGEDDAGDDEDEDEDEGEGEDEDEGEDDAGDDEGDDEGDEGDEDDAGDDEGEGEGDDTEGDDAGDDDAGEGEDEGEGEGEDEGEDEGDDAEGDTEGEDEGDTEGEDEDDDTEGDTEGEDEGDDAGGNDPEGNELDFDSLMENLMEEENGLMDTASALEAGFDKSNEDVLEDEQEWRPFSTEWDKVNVVEPYNNHQNKTRRVNRELKPVIAAIRALFKNKFLQSRQPQIRHGLRRGQDLSERKIVDSMVEIRSGKTPSRPWKRMKKAEAESLAIAVIGDQSGSMGKSLSANAAIGMYAIASAFGDLGSPILCAGVEDHYRQDQMNNPKGHYDDTFHRSFPVKYNIFKDWDEKTKQVAGRFWNYQWGGGTPLSDGIQFALGELSKREETHRIVLVITDGMPNNPDVVRRQIRLAREAGIHVVGVGIGSSCWQVTRLFPAHVSVNDITELPKELVGTVESLVFPKKGKKARFKAGVKR